MHLRTKWTPIGKRASFHALFAPPWGRHLPTRWIPFERLERSARRITCGSTSTPPCRALRWSVSSFVISKTASTWPTATISTRINGSLRTGRTSAAEPGLLPPQRRRHDKSINHGPPESERRSVPDPHEAEWQAHSSAIGGANEY